MTLYTDLILNVKRKASRKLSSRSLPSINIQTMTIVITEEHLVEADLPVQA